MIIDTLKMLVGRILKGLGWVPEKYLSRRYPQYKIGPGTYGGLSVITWNSGTTLIIGSYTSVASGVKVFLGGEHRIDWVTTYPFNALWASSKHFKGHPRSKGDVVIGNDVWIGAEALILSGVNIGDGAVIGARSVVARDVPPYAVVTGNPARVVKYRFDDSLIARLLAIQWWNWNIHEIERAMPDLMCDEIERFLDKAERGYYR